MDRYPDINWNAVDFDFIQRTENVKELTQIVDALEHEAAYPDLLNAARTRLQALQPQCEFKSSVPGPVTLLMQPRAQAGSFA